MAAEFCSGIFKETPLIILKETVSEETVTEEMYYLG